MIDRRQFVAATLAAAAFRSPDPPIPQSPGLRVNGERLNRHLAELSAFGRTPTGTSRVAYTEADVAGREYVTGLMRAAGLQVRVDTGANILGRREGRETRLPPILAGSHIDSVPDGGNFDGDVGSLGAIEVAQTLAEANVRLRHPLEVAVWSNEEGGLLGSQAFVGDLTPAEMDVVSRSGRTIRDGIRFLGGDPDRIAEARRGRGDITAYLELHIEQGGILDETGINIGVVEGIVGILTYEVTVEGFGNHAGTTPMDRRRDALLAASQVALAVNRIVTATPGRQVGTVGRMQAWPGAPNVIPGRVVMSVEVRDLDFAVMERLSRDIQAEAQRIAAASNTTVTFRLTNENRPAPTDERLRRLIARAADGLGLTNRAMPSGAGHDAQDLAKIAPAGMIFVPSVRGISHSPEELSRPQDITNGANVLLHTLLALDAGGLPRQGS